MSLAPGISSGTLDSKSLTNCTFRGLQRKIKGIICELRQRGSHGQFGSRRRHPLDAVATSTSTMGVSSHGGQTASPTYRKGRRRRCWVTHECHRIQISEYVRAAPQSCLGRLWHFEVQSELSHRYKVASLREGK